VAFDAADRPALVEFARENPLAVLATTGLDGRPESALVNIAMLDTGEIVADSQANARKVANLRQNPAVALVVGTLGSVSVQIEGIAVIARGPARDRAVASYRLWFPDSRAGDPRFEMITILPSWVRVYDISGSSPVSSEATWPHKSRTLN
jgi:general stress protein 26